MFDHKQHDSLKSFMIVLKTNKYIHKHINTITDNTANNTTFAKLSSAHVVNMLPVTEQPIQQRKYVK